MHKKREKYLNFALEARQKPSNSCRFHYCGMSLTNSLHYLRWLMLFTLQGSLNGADQLFPRAAFGMWAGIV